MHALFVMVNQMRKINCTILLYILLLCSCRVDCYLTGHDTLENGESITDSETLVSSSERFELGFFNAPGSSSSKSYVGIWYKWDPQTVVWVANRDNPVLNGSTGVSFGITKDGKLQIRDIKTGQVYWSVGDESSRSTNRSVMLMDSGNLVLREDQFATSLWESFQNATDTFLPGMKMDEALTLTSSIGYGDPGSGDFTFKQYPEEEGKYVISKKKTGDYWRSWMSGNFLSSDEMPNFPDAVANLLSNKSNCFNRTAYLSVCSQDSSIRRLVLNDAGELQYLKWKAEQGNWDLIWREPEDECSIYNACGKFGVCNINNRVLCKCLPGFQPTNPKHWDSGDFLGGCTRNSTSSDNSDMFLSLQMMKVGKPDFYSKVENETECRKEYCLENSQCQAYSYDTTGTAICWIWNSDLSNLQEEYTNGGHNLFVRVAKSVIEPTVRNCKPCGTNLIPYPLSTGPNCGEPMYFSFYCNTSSGQVSFKAPSGTYRVASINPSTQKFVIQAKHAENIYDRNSGGNLHLNQSLPFNATISSKVEAEVEISWVPPKEPTCTSLTDCRDWPNSICNITRDGNRRCLCKQNFQWNGSTLNCTKENTRSGGRNREILTLDSERHLQDLMGSGEFREEDEKGIDVPFFDLESIRVATDNFSDVNKLGQGGYGPVYKGTFPDGQEIAVKRLSSVSGQGLQEFKNEVVLIAKLQHRNLVRLRGYCIKGDEKILLYEYMPNKSLDSFIFDQKLSMRLDWEMRVNIILGIARGLLYLHHDSRLRIIHRDLKTSNILLDEEMNPKISDFGLARIVGGKETGANTTRVVGTYGYMSPEYALDGLFSVKSDVFSFGVVLLEIITGKKNTGFYQSKQAMSLIGYVWRLWVEAKVLDLMDPTLQNVCNADQFVKCVNVGLLCVQEDPNDRPTMSNVVTMLDSEAITVPTPKQPAFIPWRGLSSKASSSSKPESTYTELTSSLEEKRDTA